MKKYILFIFCAVGFISCNYQTRITPIKYYPNEFGDGNKYLLKQRFYSKILQSSVMECSLLYERVTEGNNLNRVSFIINRRMDVMDLMPVIYVKIDSSVEKMNIQKINSQFHSEETVPISSTTTMDSTGIKTNTTNGFIDQWYIDKFYIDFTPEMIAKIDVSKSMSYRLYYGPEPVTINYTLEKLNQLKELFSKK